MKKILLIVLSIYGLALQSHAGSEISVQYKLYNTSELESIKGIIIENTLYDSVAHHNLCEKLHTVANRNEGYTDWETEITTYDIPLDSIKAHTSNFYKLIDVHVKGLWHDDSFYPNLLIFTSSYYDNFKKEVIELPILTAKFEEFKGEDVFTKTIVSSNFQSKDLFDFIPRYNHTIIDITKLPKGRTLSLYDTITEVLPHYGTDFVVLRDSKYMSHTIANELTYDDFETSVSSINLRPKELEWYNLIDYFFAKQFDIKDSIVIQEKMKKVKRVIAPKTIEKYTIEKATVFHPWLDMNYNNDILVLLNKFYADDYQGCVSKHSEANGETGYNQFYWDVISEETFVNQKNTKSTPLEIRVYVSDEDMNNNKGILLPIVQLPFKEFIEKVTSLKMEDLKFYTTNPKDYRVQALQYWIGKPIAISK